jgi:hypothetical protein
MQLRSAGDLNVIGFEEAAYFHDFSGIVARNDQPTPGV